MRYKKRGKGLLINLLLRYPILRYPVLIYPVIAIIIFLIYIYGKSYLSVERAYKLNWNIKIPKIEKVLLDQEERSFTGDGDEVVVYLTNESPDANYSLVKEEEVEDAIKKIMLGFEIKKQFYPDFEKTYRWKKYVKNNGYDTVYLLFFPETGKVYLVRHSI